MTLFGTFRLGLTLVLGVVLFCPSPSAHAFDLGASIRPSLRKGAKPRSQQSSKKSPATSLLTIGAHGFSNYLYPTLTYQRNITRWMSIGLTGLYSKSKEGSTDALLYGGYLSLNIYSGGDFRGLWVHGGYGAWTFEAKAVGESERIFRAVGMVTIGFRGMLEGFLRVGISGGVLKLDPINSKLLNVEVKGTVPVVTFDIGFGF